MARNNRRMCLSKSASLFFEIATRLSEVTRYGSSRQKGKGMGIAKKYIYSKSTFYTYYGVLRTFARWCKLHYGIRRMDEGRKYVGEYLYSRLEGKNGCKKVAVITLQKTVSALAKYYRTDACSIQAQLKRFYPHLSDREFAKRIRTSPYNAIRCRGKEKQSRDCEESRVLKLFCDATGVRRVELLHITPNMFIQRMDGNVILHLPSKDEKGKYKYTNFTKGGRPRDVLVVPCLAKEVLKIAKRFSKDERIFKSVPSSFDVHRHRSKYAMTIYKLFVRNTDALTRREKYTFRCDKYSSISLDKKALARVSGYLGHGRINVVPQSYYRDKTADIYYDEEGVMKLAEASRKLLDERV